MIMVMIMKLLVTHAGADGNDAVGADGGNDAVTDDL